MRYRLRNLIMTIFASFLWGCAGVKSPLAAVPYVDLERFMGDWYVIASIPTFVEKGAHNAVEKYALNADGRIQTTFIFRKNTLDGASKEHNPTG